MRFLNRSIRVRLTAWNGGALAVTLLLFAAAAYKLISRASVEQVDDVLHLQLRTLELAVQARGSASVSSSRGMAEIAEDLQRRGYLVAFEEGDTSILVTRAIRGERAEAQLRDLAKSDELRPTTVPPRLRRAVAAYQARRRAFTVIEHGERERVRVSSAELGGRPLILVAIEPLDDVEELLGVVRGTFLVAIPVVIGLAVLVGYALARRALAPVAAMTDQAERIDGRTLHERLDVANPRDELGGLAKTFNAVLDRVDSALEQQRRFTADASHELRTPVAVIRSEAEVALESSQRTTEHYRDALTVIRGGSEHLSRIVNDLFLLARADAGQVGMISAPIYLDDLVMETVRAVRSLAAAKSIEICVTACEETIGSGDEALLRRVLVNLLDNAIKYAPEASRIRVELRTDENGHQVLVTDVGPGVPHESRPFIFDRFYRADTARARQRSEYGTGAGLGLSIAHEIATLHGGTLALVETGGGETTFELRLPLAVH